MGSTIIISLIVIFLGLAIGSFAGYRHRQRQVQFQLETAQAKAEALLTTAEAECREAKLEGEAERDALARIADEEASRREKRLEAQTERVTKRQAGYQEQLQRVKGQEKALNKRHSQLQHRRNQINKLLDEQFEALERVSQTTKADAITEILEQTHRLALESRTHRLHNIEDDIKQYAERKARDLITLSIQRIHTRQVAPAPGSTVTVSNVSRIEHLFGTDRQHLPLLENLTEVEFSIDEEALLININAPDPVKREVARRTLEALLQHKRIQAKRIEGTVKKIDRNVQNTIKRAGRSAVRKAKVRKLPPDIVELLGRLEYRTSYGQNQRLHLIETAHLAAIMAAELGADVETARLGGLLHDIGKALTHEIDGPHALIGAETLEKYNLPAAVINAVASHHHEVEQESLEAIIVEAADAISGARPGARRENLENYVARIEELQNIANSFSGVKESYAIQAGREIRVMVNPDKVDDAAARDISIGIARKVEENMQYPGQIAITVIRETKAVDYAR